MISNSSVVFDQVFPNTVLAKKAGINSSSTTSTSASGILPSGKMGSKLSTEPPTRPPSSSLNNEKILSPPPPPKVAVNQLPVANAGQPKIVKSGDIVTLDGSGSFDPDGDRLRYFWTGISLTNANTPNPTFIAPAVNTEVIYTFHLVVNDGKLDSKPSPAPNFTIILVPRFTLETMGFVRVTKYKLGYPRIGVGSEKKRFWRS